MIILNHVIICRDLKVKKYHSEIGQTVSSRHNSLPKVNLVVFGDGAGLAVIIALLGLFLYSDQPLLTAAALDIVGHNVATSTLGVLSFSRFALSAVSPLIAGFLYQARGIDATFQYAAALFALAAVLLMFTRLKPLQRTLHDQNVRHHSHS